MARLVQGVLAGRIPFIEVGREPRVLVIRGGQAFIRRADPARAARDARRVARLLPKGCGFVLLGYDPDPPPGLDAGAIVRITAAAIEERWSGPVPVLGTSYGAMVAARLAAERPDLVERLVLVAGVHRFSAEGQQRVRRQMRLAAAGDWPGFAGELTALFRNPWRNAAVRLLVRLSRRRLAQAMAPRDAIVRYLRAMEEAPPVALEAIAAPTLIVGGSADQLYGGVMEEAATRIAGARLVLLEGETHMAPVERARDVRRAIAAFLAGRP